MAELYRYLGDTECSMTAMMPMYERDEPAERDRDLGAAVRKSLGLSDGDATERIEVCIALRLAAAFADPMFRGLLIGIADVLEKEEGA